MSKSKKSFGTAASRFFTQEPAQEATQEAAQEVAQEVAQERRPITTQGRKGKGKPRINMAFEPDIYNFIKREAERLDMSMTQYVNNVLYDRMEGRK